MGNGKAVADERLLVYLDEKGNGPEIGQRILVKGNVGFFDPAANPGNFDQKIIISSRISRQSYGKGRFWKNR